MSVDLTRLPGGVIVVSERMPSFGTAAVSVAFGSGARSETPHQHGLAHLLEHMAFKGTVRRSARDIAEEIEAVGGDLNAATGVEQTAYYARVMGEHVPLAMDILGDILTSPTFAEDELEREKGVIVQEIGAVDDTPDDLIFDVLQEAAFPEQALGRSILGTPDSVRAMTRHDLTAFLGEHYRAPRAVVAAAGAVDHDELVRLAERHLAGLPAGDAPPTVPARYAGGECRLVRDLEQAHVALAFPGRAITDPATYALQIFTNALGGGMSSRLFQEVREKRGLAYTIQSFHWSYADTGLFGIYAGTAEEDLAELMEVSVEETLKAAEGLTDSEISRAKAQLKMGLLMAMEQPGARIDQMTRHIFAFGKPIPPEDILARLDAVTRADVRDAAFAMLASAPTLAAIGPVGGLAPGERIAERVRARAA